MTATEALNGAFTAESERYLVAVVRDNKSFGSYDRNCGAPLRYERSAVERSVK